MARSTACRPLPWRLLVAVALLGGLGGLALGWQRGEEAPDITRWHDLVQRTAQAEGVDAALLAALLATESRGDAAAVSRAGARGLVQLMPATAAEEAARRGQPPPTDEQLLEPERNLALGAGYLKRLLERYDGEVAFAVAAYNAGPSRVDRWRARAYDAPAREVIEREGFAETRRHLQRVLAWRTAYAAAGLR